MCLEYVTNFRIEYPLLPYIYMSKGTAIIYGRGGGWCKIKKSHALKMCPPLGNYEYIFAPLNPVHLNYSAYQLPPPRPSKGLNCNFAPLNFHSNL